MKFIKSKKGLVLLATLVVAAAAAIGGYAYFTGTGSGTGSANVGSATNTITVVGTETANLYPGGPGGAVSFTASNGSNFNQKLSNIHLVSIAPDAGHASCATVIGTDFSMADVPVGADGDLAPNASNVALTEGGTLNMLDSGVSQDACQGATLTLTFSTS